MCGCLGQVGVAVLVGGDAADMVGLGGFIGFGGGGIRCMRL